MAWKHRIVSGFVPYTKNYKEQIELALDYYGKDGWELCSFDSEILCSSNTPVSSLNSNSDEPTGSVHWIATFKRKMRKQSTTNKEET
jgi:hypothetical protein